MPTSSGWSINLYGLEDGLESGKLVYDVARPLYYSKNSKANHINLLYIKAALVSVIIATFIVTLRELVVVHGTF